MTEEKPPSRDVPLVEWAQRINGQYSSVVRWVGLLGFVVFASLGHLEAAAAFGGLIPVSYAVGKG